MKKKNKSFGEALAVGSALAGAALGAAAVILSDKKNQEKIKKTVDDLSDEAVKIGKSVKSKVDEFAKKTSTKVTAKKAPAKKATVKKTSVKKARSTSSGLKKATTPPTGKVYTPKKK